MKVWLVIDDGFEQIPIRTKGISLERAIIMLKKMSKKEQ
jgi:hypothetical protein